MTDLRLRETALPPSAADRTTLERMMAALQDFERETEPNREPGADMAADHVEALIGEGLREGGGAILAEDAAGPCGFILYLMQTEFGRLVAPENRRYGVLTDLWVEPRARRRRLGHRLIEAAEARLAALGARRIEVTAIAGNAPAQALYAAAGYAPSAVTMAKRVGSPR
ncbi:MAG: GNAT family N-acetyltransferase [Pseudomonadota bacterium]